MELTLKRLLEQATFHKVRKGYDTDEVDEFLDRAVGMATKVEARLNQVMAQEGGGGEAAAEPVDVEAEVERRVAERLAALPAPEPAAAPAGPSAEEAAEEAARTLVLAQRTADAAVKEAREEAERIVAAARQEASSIAEGARVDADRHRETALGEVERERREARARLAEAIRRLEADRDSLRADVTILENHVEEQRTQLRSAVAELQRLLDDPAGFRSTPVPALRGPESPVLIPEDPGGDAGMAEADIEPEAEAFEAERTGGEAADPSPTSGSGSDPAPDEAADPPAAPEASAAGDGAGPDARGGADDVVGLAAEAPDSPSSASIPEPDVVVLESARAFAEVDHSTPGVDDPEDDGPPTAPVATVDITTDGDRDPAPAGNPDDEFLDELRRAMAEQEPLGPREDLPFADQGTMFDDERRGWRFGKRR